MFKVIIFDLGGVLFTNGTRAFVRDISQKYNLDYDFVHDVIDGELGTEYREAKITRDEFWKSAVEKLNLTENIDDLEAQWINGYELIEDTKKIIAELAKKYRVFYLSDNVKERVDRLNEKYDFLKMFEAGIFSHDVGVRKPHPKIYRHTLEKAGIHAEESVFIDDKEKMLIPARELGIETIVFTSPEQLRADLVKLSILG